MVNKIILGDCIETLKTIPSEFVNCCVTSPPYYGLRDYGANNQIGLENTPYEYIDKLVLIFREVRRILRDDGTLWVNIGDSYAGSGKGMCNTKKKSKIQPLASYNGDKAGVFKDSIIKQKDLIGIPWMLAFALRADCWYLRQDIIWHKPNPTPESVTDRCVKAHEYIFLLSKSAYYYFDSKAIRETAVSPPEIRNKSISRCNITLPNGSLRFSPGVREYCVDGMRNKRDVWTVSSAKHLSNDCEHFATYHEKLIVPCILSGCPENGIVLDPFIGSGTTALVCIKLLRRYIGCELNPEYIKIAEKRISTEKGLFYANDN